MKITCRILRVNDDNHSFAVRFYTDFLTEDELAGTFDEKGRIQRHEDGYPLGTRTDVNINFYGNLCPTEEDLMKTLKNAAPYYHFWLVDNIDKKKTDLSQIKKFVGKEFEIEVEREKPNDNEGDK